MKQKAGTSTKFRAKSGRVVLAAGLLCSVPSIANQGEHGIENPANLMPQVFTRIEYVKNNQNIAATKPPKQRSNPKAPGSLGQLDFINPLGMGAQLAKTKPNLTKSLDISSPRTAEPAQSYKQQDLDLALENFFYALEDLIQSASRYSEEDTNQETYFAQVQFPAQVMTALNTTPATPAATDRATAVASATPANTAAPASLPPTTAEAEPDSLFAFIEDFNFKTNVGAVIEHNDNIYTTRTNPRTDVIARTHINTTAESGSRKKAIKFEGDIETGNYNDNPDNNYVDWSGTASYSTLLSQRSKAFVGAGYFYHHEEKGEGSTDGDDDGLLSLAEPVEFESWVARGIYERGTKQTRARLLADAKIDQLRTTNFQDIPAIKGRDRDINSIIGTAFYNWSQRLSYLIELRHLDIEYVNSNGENSLDSTQTRYAVGTEWLATRKTAGSVRIGIQEKDFDNNPARNNTSLSWEAIVEWAPIPRSEIILETIQDTEESDGFGTARDRTDYKLTWKQKWTPRLDSRTSLQHGTTDFRGTDFEGQLRRDELTLVHAELTYSLNTSTSASLKLTYIDNSSNVTEYSFDRSQIQLGLDMEL